MAFDDGIKTVSGSIAHTDDAAAKVPFVSVKCGIEPTLSGVSSVTETQTGKSVFLPMDIEQGSISGSGYNSESIYRIRTAERKAVTPSTQYKIKVNSEVQIYEVHEYADLTGSSTHLTANSSEYTFTTKSTTNYLKILFRYSNNTAITPSAITELQVTDGDFYWKTYTASLGRTIYGGTADIVNGTGTENEKGKWLSELSWTQNATFPHVFNGTGFTDRKKGINWNNATCLSDRYTGYTSSEVGTKSEGIALGTGATNTTIYVSDDRFETVAEFTASLETDDSFVVLPLETPTDFTFTPITPTPETVGKVNNVYCNTGDTELTYYDNAHGFAEVTVNKTGKNLFDISKVATTGTTAGISWSVSGNEITISGTATSSGWKTFVEFKLPHKGTYHFHMNATGNVGYFLRGWTQLVGKDVTEVCNDPSQVYRIAIAVTTTGQTYEGTISEIQIEVGDAYTSYEPYEAVSKTAYLHKVVYGGKADVIRGTCEPKNLLSMKNYDGGVYNPDVGRQLNLTVSQTQFERTGGVYSVTTSATWKTFTVLFPIISGATYYEKWTLSVESGQQGYTRAYLDEDFKVLARYNNNSSDPMTINWAMSPPTGAKYLAITWTNRGTAVQTLNITEPQIEKGTSASDFAPHFEPFSFPPISMSTDEGENTLFANEGDSAITYRKETD